MSVINLIHLEPNMKRTHRQKRGEIDLDDLEEEVKFHQVMASHQPPPQRKKYKKVHAEQRDQLLIMVRGGTSVNQASQALGINYENAKYLWRAYRDIKKVVPDHDSCRRKRLSSEDDDQSSSGGNRQNATLFDSGKRRAKKVLQNDVADAMSGLLKL